MKKNSWLELVRPDLYLGSVYDLPAEQLKDLGIRALVFDLDNTLLHWNVRTVPEEMLVFFAGLKEYGFGCCLLSNNKRDRVEVVAQVLQVPAISKARKPRRRAFRQALALLGTSVQETAVIGDQLFTDILGGNRLGLYTILVVPLSRHEFIGTRLVRHLERLVLALLVRQSLVKKPPGGTL